MPNIALAKKWASKYGLDWRMVCALIEQESDWNPWATRFEPEFLIHYIEAMKGLDHTEQEHRATSFGLMQIMGQTARDFGFTGRFLTELCDPDMGVDFGCRKLQKCFQTHGADEAGLLCYNGGGNAEYGKQVLARLSHYPEG